MKHDRRAGLWCIAFVAAMAVNAGAQDKPKEPKKTPKDSTTEVYGFVQGDAIFDFDQNNPDWFDVNRPTKLPAFHNEFGGNNHMWFSARQTRFGVKTVLPGGHYDFKAHFEFDMFGVGVDAGQTTIRLRLAYGQWGPFGAGQLWSPFMDVDVFPNILDYWGPNGMIFYRNVMVFWQPIEKENGSKITVALERPGASADREPLSDRIELQNIVPRFPWPDLSAGFKLAGKPGYVKLAGIVRSMRWDDILNDTFDLSGGTTGWGVSLSGNAKFGKKDVLRLQGVYGKGVENYFNDAPVDIGIQNQFFNIRRPIVGSALPITGIVAFLDHNWNKVWTSSIGYSSVNIDNSSGQADFAFHNGQYGIVNLLSQPRPDVMIGGEFQWGRRDNFRDDFHFDDYRLQFSFRYNYSRTFGGGHPQ